MKSWQTTNNIQVYLLLSGRANVFLIQFESHFMLVDTGGFLIWNRLKRRIYQTIGSGKLDFLFLTHSHFDHARNAFRINKEFGCKIIVDENEANFLAEGRSPLPPGNNSITKIITWLGKNLTSIERYSGVKCDIRIDDIYEIKTRDDIIRILRTPGHSPGSASIILNSEIALVGDTLYKAFLKPGLPPFLANKNALLASWEKLLNTGCEVFLPGHGSPISRSELESLFDRYKK